MEAARALAALAFAVLLAGCDRQPAPLLRPDDPQVTALGATIYQARCAACHGARLEGQPNWRMRDPAGRLPAPPHDASGHSWHHPDAVLVAITKHGVARAAGLQEDDTAMPAFDGVLTDAEIVAVLSWIKAQWPPEIRRQQDEVNAAAHRNR
jgi:mono/diheme cytochrome c family protein